MTNRPIKFRAWLKEKKVMANYVSNLKHGPDCGVFEITVPFDESGLNTFRKIHSVDEFVLMQYTGLHDKNGKGIYEGDLLMAGDDVAPVLVEWDEERNGWSFNKDFVNERYLGEPTKRSAEVIGNVFENPDLV
jgi:uncharacterized phage protein (TIGR01671 family)